MAASEKVIKTFIAKFKVDGSDLEKTYAKLGKITEGFIKGFSKGFSGIVNTILHPVKTIEKILSGVVNIFKSIGRGILNFIMHPIESIKKGFKGLISFLGGAFKIALTAPFKAMATVGKLAISGISKALKALPGLVSAAFGKLKDMTSSFMDSMSTFLNFDAKSTMSPEYVSRLADAMSAFGGTSEDAVNSIENIQRALNDAYFGEGTLIEAAKKYGLILHDNNGQLLSVDAQMLEISKRMQGLSKAQQVDFMSILGLNDDAIFQLLQEGPKAVQNRLSNASFVVNEEDLKNAKSLRESINNIKQSFKAMGLNTQRVIIPFIEQMLNMIKDVPKIIQGVFTTTKIGSGLKKTITPFFSYFARQIKRVKTLLRGISIDNFMDSMPKLKEFFKDTIDDLSNTFSGIIKNGFAFLKDNGPSIAAFIIESLKLAFEFVKEALPKLAGFIGEAIGLGLKGVINLGKWIAESLQEGGSEGILKGIQDMLASIANLIGDVFVNFFNGILSTAFGTSLSEIGNYIKEKLKNIPGIGRIIDSIFSSDMMDGFQGVSNAVLPAVTNTTNNGGNANVNINNNIEINNPKNSNAVAKDIVRETNRQINSARALTVQTASGVQ